MKKKWIGLAMIPFLLQPISAVAEEAETEIITEDETEATEVQLIGQGVGTEILVGERVDLGDYEITVSNVRIGQNAGTKVADPAHKYLCLDVSILNWMLEDLPVDPVLNWFVIYDEEYRFACDTYQPSVKGMWEGLATNYDEKQIYYIIKIEEVTEEGTLQGRTMRMEDGNYEEIRSSWEHTGSYDETTGILSIQYGERIQGNNNRMSLDGTVQDSVIEGTVFWEDGVYGVISLTRMEYTDSPVYNTVIAPLVEQQYHLCVLLTNAAANGLNSGELVLNMVIGGECYTVNLK